MDSRKWRARLWAYAPVVLWIGVIFLMSSNFGSSANTSLIVGPLLHFLFPSISEATVDLVHAFVRKSAHFCEYAVLGALAARTFRSLAPLSRLTGALLVVIAIALADEFNQSFNPARTSSLWDSALDTCGGLTAIVIVLLLTRRRARG